jgi:hypothetical protein
MPSTQYFGWVGSLLLAALLAANWCFKSLIAVTAPDLPFKRKITAAAKRSLTSPNPFRKPPGRS